jgi:hypothetical protein
MMNMRRLISFLLLIFLVGVGWGLGLAQQVSSEEQQAEEQGKIIPAPKDIKERTAIYVFLGWMWVSIIVLVYILKLKINEVDRLLDIKFYDEKDKS